MKKIVFDLPDKTVITSSQHNENLGSVWKAQSEKELEAELIDNLSSQGYEYVRLSGDKDLEKNLRRQLEKLNAQRIPNFRFTDSEWKRFYSENFEGPNNQGITKRAEKIHDGDCVISFTRDDKTVQNIKILEKRLPQNNYVQVMNQFSHIEGSERNRYDVTILVNGLPLVHIELKRRGNSLKEAFFQVDKYKHTMPKLFEFIQIFVISNGTYTKYYSNTTKRNINANSFLFTSFWSYSCNTTIKDIELFSKTFLEKRVLLEILCKYCVFDSEKNLKILRPYQISAIEGIICKIRHIIKNPKFFQDPIDSKSQSRPGGYVWHTTGSGKTLTSFKAAQLALEIPEVNKVLFIVDRKSLDQQTQREYKKFMGDDTETLGNTQNTKALTRMMDSDQKRIIITTIQKLKRFIESATPEIKSRLKNERIVMIMDECHRSQTDKIHRAVNSLFANKMMFGFTGTPLLRESQTEEEGTPECFDECEKVFGERIHRYQIIHAIQDGNVLKFRVEYWRSVGKFSLSDQDVYQYPRIEKIATDILGNFDILSRQRKFNAIFATESIDMAIKYYSAFKDLQKTVPEKDRVKIVMIFSPDFDIPSYDDETQPTEHVGNLTEAIQDYNQLFGCNFSEKDFDGYRDDVAKRTRNKEIDILLVVNMFLTGYDAPCINTVLVDKNLEAHNLIQAFSRANRVLNKDKPHANIICYRDLKKKVDRAFTLFALDTDDIAKFRATIEVASYKERLAKYRQYEDDLISKYPVEKELTTTEEKEGFARTYNNFRECLNTLVDDERFNDDRIIKERQCQDYKTKYMDVMDFLRREIEEKSDVEPIISKALETYDLELISCDDINIDYILNLIDRYRREQEASLREEIMRHVNSHTSFRKEREIVTGFLERIDGGQNDIGYLDYKKQKFMQASEDMSSRLDLKISGVKKWMEKFWESRKTDFTGTVRKDVMPDLNWIIDYKKIKTIWTRFKHEAANLLDLFNINPDQDDDE